ncbi:hypothetical protein BT96DRAFT_919044 [Gymnopus androsaceus JB14]|uniref:acireductone dioxygenase (Fe(2+)-requiring) n=1 Tax=Gymnopus androsaceus JB14 TaxID=1447944 RepID=A0A6A4HTG0_9AGAR|nr:hypothetical protein BT96DRAFT_919044 [Gymnopus androsaceus JB14]
MGRSYHNHSSSADETMLHNAGISHIDEGFLEDLGYRLRKLVHPSKDYKFQTQLLARALGYPEQKGRIHNTRDAETFAKEVTHAQECMYYIVSGTCYFDVRFGGGTEDWIRIVLHTGDTMIVPAGSYHKQFPLGDDFESMQYTKCNPSSFQSVFRE